MYLKKKTKVIISPKYLDTYNNVKYFKIIFDFYKKKYPKLFNNFLSSHKGHKLAKKELGFDYALFSHNSDSANVYINGCLHNYKGLNPSMLKSGNQ
jgi:hypothetical protein